MIPMVILFSLKTWKRLEICLALIWWPEKARTKSPGDVNEFMTRHDLHHIFHMNREVEPYNNSIAERS